MSYLKLGARYYNPTTGRFTQPDPSGQETNTFTYAGDDPINNVDPSGYWANDLVNGLAVVGTIALFVGLSVGTGGVADVALAVGILSAETGTMLGLACSYADDSVKANC